MTEELKTVCPVNQQQWRAWLREHHDTEKSVWLIYYRKRANRPTITWSEAVDEALCFGWIDSTIKPLDEDRFMQFFSRRKPNSVWSKINKENVQRLMAEGRMTQAGFASIETAKQNGSWTILDDAEALIIPPDLEQEFQEKPNARSYFSSLSRSDKRNLLQWIVLAKRPETRQKRITELVELADQNRKPQFMQGTKKRA